MTTARHVATCLCILAVGAGCTPETTTSILDAFVSSFGSAITIPDSDSTPPAVSLTVPDPPGEDVVLTPGGPGHAASLDLEGRFFVVAAAKDPEGVKEVQIVGSATVRCMSDAGIGQDQFFSINVTDVDDSEPGGTGLTRRWIPYSVSPSNFACVDPSEFEVTEVTIELRGRGSNFFGLSDETPEVVFTYVP